MWIFHLILIGVFSLSASITAFSTKSLSGILAGLGILIFGMFLAGLVVKDTVKDSGDNEL